MCDADYKYEIEAYIYQWTWLIFTHGQNPDILSLLFAIQTKSQYVFAFKF